MRRPVTNWTLTLALLLGAAGLPAACVGGSKGTSAGDLEKLKPYILESVPGDIPNKLDINYENKIHLVGYKIEPVGTAAPGTDVKLTMYWRCDDKVDDGWSLFTHIVDSNGERILNIDNVGPLREMKESHQALWPSAWEKGKVYVDEQSFRMPEEAKTADVAVTTGIWKGDARLKVVGGPADGENRGIVVRLKTGAENKPSVPHTDVPQIRVNRLAKGDKINVDGKLDEQAWKAAASTGPFVDVGTGNPNTSFPVNGSAKLAWDDTHLYIGFEVEDPDLVGTFPKDAKDPHLWTKDTVEIMADPDGDGDNNDYYEIQVNPQNLVFRRHARQVGRQGQRLHGRVGDPLGIVRQGEESPPEAGRRMAHEFLRHEEQLRRRLVGHPRTRQLPQSIPLRARRLDDGRYAASPRTCSFGVGCGCRIGGPDAACRLDATA